MAKVLLIEDDDGIITPLSLYIEQSGYEIAVCKDGGDALDIFHTEKPDIIILDINLPWKSGIEVCRDVRKESETPIIVLSARESEDDKVTLLELGADDYVSKPFSPRELMARISAIIKRSEQKKKNTKTTKVLEFGKLQIDGKNYTVLMNGEDVRLTKTEFSILEYFVKNMKNVIKRDALMRDIIGYDNYLYDRTIDTHVKNIRKKLDGAIEIETIRGIWYRVRSV
jgi:DNA-binding response OmpR family regulator